MQNSVQNEIIGLLHFVVAHVEAMGSILTISNGIAKQVSFPSLQNI